MRYKFKKDGWKYREHFWFAWRPVFIQSGGDSAIVFREWVVRWYAMSGGGPNAMSGYIYRECTNPEKQGHAALEGKTVPQGYHKC